MNAIVPYAVSDIERMAHALAKSKLFGIQTPEQAMALCLVAQSEGRHPATAAQDYHILQGRPAKKADAMLRDFLAGGGKVEWHQLDDTKVDATFSHPAGGSARIDWTMARAKQAGLATQMWSKYPRQMLRARVVSEGVRTVFPMATSGMYVPEEVREFADDTPHTRPVTAIEDLRDANPSEPDNAAPAPLNASQAKKSGKGEIAARLANEITDLQSTAECLAWRRKNTPEIDTWPTSWRDGDAGIWAKYDLHYEELRELEASASGADDDTFPPDRKAA